MGYTPHIEAALDRGTDVHTACALDDSGVLDEESVTAEVRPYLRAWRLFREQTGVVFHEIEQARACARFRGTPDRVASFPPSERAWIIDIKTGHAAPWHRLQTAAYAELRGLPGAAARASIYLAADGTYTMETHDRRQDHAAWSAALAWYTWLKQEGLV
jgi:hypothetical protein